jgi:hypothetical protein
VTAPRDPAEALRDAAVAVQTACAYLTVLARQIADAAYDAETYRRAVAAGTLRDMADSDSLPPSARDMLTRRADALEDGQ